MDLDDFANVNTSGLTYTTLKDPADEVVGLAVLPLSFDVVIYSNQKALRTKLTEIPRIKRMSQGSLAMATDNPIEGLSVIYPDTRYILVVTNKGRINKFSINALTPHKRNTGGINVIKLDKSDSIFAIHGVNDSDVLRAVTSNGVIDVPVADIKERSTVAVGDKGLIKGALIRTDIIR